MSNTMSVGGHPVSNTEVLDDVRETYLTAYPNSGRLGCPSPQLIRDLAAERFRPAPESDILQHLTRCSDCYREFRSERTPRSRHAMSEAIRLATLASIVFAIGMLALRILKKS